MRNVCTGLPLPPGHALSQGNALSTSTDGHLIPIGGSVCGVGAVVGRVLVGRGGQSREKGPARLPASYLLVTMVAKVTLRGSGESIDGCLRNVLMVLLVAWRGRSRWAVGLDVTGILAPEVSFLGDRSLKGGRPFGLESGFFSGDSFGGCGGSALSMWCLCGR